MSKKALIVDNDFFFVEFLSDLLEKSGYQIIKAYDGKEGISKLEDGPIDLLFTDIIMPKIDGLNLIKFSRKKFPGSSLKIIAVSGALIEQFDEINKIGADYYIVKGPLEQMAAHIKTFIERVDNQQDDSYLEEKGIIKPGRLFPRQATSGLIDSMNFQHAVIESIGVGIIVVDKDTRAIKANSLALNMLNRPIEDVLNAPVTSLFPKKENARLINAFKRVVQDQGIKKIGLNIVFKAQDIKLIISLLRLNGEAIGWIIAMEGIKVVV